MSSWLLTWNPEKWQWTDYDEDCEKALNEPSISFSWSCHSKKVKVGDEFFLMKQGKPPRGIIAHGTITKGMFEERHWDENKSWEIITYLEGECDTLMNYKTEEILDVSILDEKCPQQFWHPQSSGISIKDEVLPTLHELWAEVTRYYPEKLDESFYVEGGTSEGAKISFYTTRCERDPKVRRAFLEGKHLKCEVCGFDFEAVYGKLGAGYIEVHHTKPVCEGERITDINNDLVMLCSNCHKMIHRGKGNILSIEELKGLIAQRMGRIFLA